MLTFMTRLSLGNIIYSAKKKNVYILGFETTSHLKVFSMNLKTGLAPWSSLSVAVLCLRQAAGWAALSTRILPLIYHDLTDTSPASLRTENTKGSGNRTKIRFWNFFAYFQKCHIIITVLAFSLPLWWRASPPETLHSASFSRLQALIERQTFESIYFYSMSPTTLSILKMLYNKYKVLICIFLGLEFLFLDSPSLGVLIFLYPMSWKASSPRTGSRWNADLCSGRNERGSADWIVCLLTVI